MSEWRQVSIRDDEPDHIIYVGAEVHEASVRILRRVGDVLVDLPHLIIVRISNTLSIFWKVQ